MEVPVVTFGGPYGSKGESSNVIEFFALVAYLPAPLSEFLHDLRRDLDPRFGGRPHLTILPPRPLKATSNQAWAELLPLIVAGPPIGIELGDVETFKESQVIYLSLRKGYSVVEELHKHLNVGCASCGEAWPFHPHVTLAHGLPLESFEKAAVEARRRWHEYRGPREFTVDRLTWVKTTIVPGVSDRGTRSMIATNSEWVDLAESQLSAQV